MKQLTWPFCMCFTMFLTAGSITACNKKIHTSVAAEDTLNKTTAIEKTAAVFPDTFGFGQSVSTEYIRKFDIDVRPDGRGLPAGAGMVKEGRSIYLEKCTVCHGKTGREGGPGGKLVSSPPDSNKTKTIGNYWPYATTVYDYINRAMPYNAPGSLTSKEVYDLTAYLLYENGIIDSAFVITEKTLPLIEMPAKKLFVPDNRLDEIKSGSR